MSHPLRIALIADSFPPLQNSAAIQLRDLAREIALQGHFLTVILPATELKELWNLESVGGYQILRLRAPQTKGIHYVMRTIGEFLMPFVMYWHFKKSPLTNEKWSGVIWYSPSIFLGFFTNFLKKKSRCNAYLIVRDIFPEWAVDLGLIKYRGLSYYFFRAIARYQYSVANIIGVQSSGNLTYFKNWMRKSNRKLEVLQNWLGEPKLLGCSIQLNQTILAGRKVFVYAGNMGVAQNMLILVRLAQKFQSQTNIGFLFVGQGSEVSLLKSFANQHQLDNIVFFDEIHSDQIPGLYAQCIAGMIALDNRHKSHNIPGKFLTYIQNGLPVLACVNLGNDIASLIRDENIGQVCESNRIEDLFKSAENILEQISKDINLPFRCRKLFDREFSSKQAARQILKALI